MCAARTNRPTARPARRRAALPRHYRGDSYRAEDSVGYLLRVALSAVKRRLDRKMTEHEMTGVQMLPLFAISRGVCRTAAELARLNDTDPGATTRMLDRLESKGLLRRVRDTRDRRIVQLELTAAGRALAHKIPFAIAETLNEALRDFSAAEVDMLRGMLRRIAANAESVE